MYQLHDGEQGAFMALQMKGVRMGGVGKTFFLQKRTPKACILAEGGGPSATRGSPGPHVGHQNPPNTRGDVSDMLDGQNEGGRGRSWRGKEQ